MSWNTANPADNSSLRLLGQLIRPNWEALETGNVPFDALKLQEQAGNPTREDNFGFLFTKEDDSQTQLYYMDDENPATVVQLTGISWSKGSGNDYGITTPWGLIMNWGSVSSTGNTPKAITFKVPYSSAAMVHSVVVTAVSDQGSSRGAVVSSSSVTSTGFSVRSTNSGMTVYYYVIGSSA